MITTKISMLNQCAFCVDANAYLFLKKGGMENKIDALPHFQKSDCFSDKEKAALTYAEAMTIERGPIADAIFTSLKVHFDDDAIVELTALIAFQNMSSKFNSALDAKSFGFCKLPQ